MKTITLELTPNEMHELSLAINEHMLNVEKLYLGCRPSEVYRSKNFKSRLDDVESIKAKLRKSSIKV